MAIADRKGLTINPCGGCASLMTPLEIRCWTVFWKIADERRAG